MLGRVVCLCVCWWVGGWGQGEGFGWLVVLGLTAL